MTQSFAGRRALIATVIISLGACSRHRTASNPSPAPRPSAPANAAPARGNLREGNIIAILFAANNTDISYARLAQSRGQSQGVKDFAQQMITDHMAVNQAVTDMMNRLQISPEENKTSLDFRDESTAKREMLRAVDGRAFDKAYVENEVMYHTNLLAEIDSVLLPLARDPQLRQLISNIRPAVAGHLAHARQLQGMSAGTE